MSRDEHEILFTMQKPKIINVYGVLKRVGWRDAEMHGMPAMMLI